MRQIPLPIAPPSAPAFDNFMPGANAAALAHLDGLEGPAAPVYLWGSSGSGKTHLMQAIVHRYAEHGLRSGWFSAAGAAPWVCDDAWALIAIDDCHALDADQQHAAFGLFVHAAARGIPLIAAGRVPPVDLAVREDLRTRLGWGHVFAIHPLDEPAARAALRREADRRALFFSDDVMDYLLTRFARDLKHLMALLDRLDTFSLATKRAITVPLLKKMLAEEGPA